MTKRQGKIFGGSKLRKGKRESVGGGSQKSGFLKKEEGFGLDQIFYTLLLGKKQKSSGLDCRSNVKEAQKTSMWWEGK